MSFFAVVNGDNNTVGNGEKQIHKSDAELVREFTKETGSIVPNEPQLMNKEEVFFTIKMMLDEIMELGATVSNPHEVKMNMIKMICNSKDIEQINGVSTFELIGEQGDALVDCYYYSLNAAAKKGINISRIFEVVHKANMDKRDPVSKKFIKPPGWLPPDITSEIKRQFKEGSFVKN